MWEIVETEAGKVRVAETEGRKKKERSRKEMGCYKLKNLELFKRKNLVLGLIQENLIENSVQDHLSYILNHDGPCYYLSCQDR